MLEKIISKNNIIAIATGLSLATFACDDGPGKCDSANYQAVNTAEKVASALYSADTKEYGKAVEYACANGDCCRDSCSYDSSSGCCWCPD